MTLLKFAALFEQFPLVDKFTAARPRGLLSYCSLVWSSSTSWVSSLSSGLIFNAPPNSSSAF